MRDFGMENFECHRKKISHESQSSKHTLEAKKTLLRWSNNIINIII